MGHTDSSSAVSVLDIDHSELVRCGADVFRELERGTIFYVRGLGEVQDLTDHIRSVLRTHASGEQFKQVSDFFESGRPISRGALLELIMCLRAIRDARYLSCLFSDLIAGFGLPAPTLIDTGFFRCVFSNHVQALSRDPRLPPDILEGKPPGPEGFLQGFTGTGNPHRDVDAPHYTFQINFWFPLHDVEAENSLLLFPDAYTSNVPYQVRPEHPQEPERWGYGRPLSKAMRRGDIVLFHSQHFHASPTQAPLKDRLTAELRVASGCVDDNGSIYRRQFWNSQSFAPFSDADTPTIAERSKLLFPSSAKFETATTPQELLASVMSTPKDVRITGNLWNRDTIFSETRRLDANEADVFAGRMIAAPFAEDRQLCVGRYLLFHGYSELAERVLTDIAARTERYYFALEVARICGAARLWSVAGKALSRAIAVGGTSPVRLGRYRGDVPTRAMPPLQLLPQDAVRIATTLASALRDYLADPSRHPAPLLDHRIFYPHFVVARPLRPFGAVVGTWTLAIFVPIHRMADAGLRFITVDGEERIEVAFKPEALVCDPTGVVVGHSAEELRQMLQESAAKGDLQSKCGA
jgi:hypothetical protein